MACLAGLNTAASVFFQTNNEYPDISKSARTSTVVYGVTIRRLYFLHAHALRTRLSFCRPCREPGYEAT